MTDSFEDIPLSPAPQQQYATGAILDEKYREEVLGNLNACGADIGVEPYKGALQRAINSGIHYHNIKDFEADFVRGQGSSLIKSRREITTENTLMPLYQRTGICNGCSHSGAGWESWVAHYVKTGTGLVPREVTFALPYLAARPGLRGDSGAIPSYAVEVYHDLGLLPIDCPGPYKFLDMPSHGNGSQEEVCVRLRDRFTLPNEWRDYMKSFKTRVHMPRDHEECGDCLASDFCVTLGMSLQNTETQEGSNGVSGFYSLGGGHETFLDGWFTLGGRVGFLKMESWGDYPASNWPGRRVVLQTDDGPKKLYRGQGAVWADELFRRARPEAWAIGVAGSL